MSTIEPIHSAYPPAKKAAVKIAPRAIDGSVHFLSRELSSPAHNKQCHRSTPVSTLIELTALLCIYRFDGILEIIDVYSKWRNHTAIPLF
jgi:hypothetical protein